MSLRCGVRCGRLPIRCLDRVETMMIARFVGLMKASKLGYARTNRDILQQAEELCWQMLLK